MVRPTDIQRAHQSKIFLILGTDDPAKRIALAGFFF